jgi:hypothetical protein
VTSHYRTGLFREGGATNTRIDAVLDFIRDSVRGAGRRPLAPRLSVWTTRQMAATRGSLATRATIGSRSTSHLLREPLLYRLVPPDGGGVVVSAGGHAPQRTCGTAL